MMGKGGLANLCGCEWLSGERATISPVAHWPRRPALGCIGPGLRPPNPSKRLFSLTHRSPLVCVPSHRPLLAACCLSLVSCLPSPSLCLSLSSVHAWLGSSVVPLIKTTYPTALTTHSPACLLHGRSCLLVPSTTTNTTAAAAHLLPPPPPPLNTRPPPLYPPYYTIVSCTVLYRHSTRTVLQLQPVLALPCWLTDPLP